jgi:hypothetical protein
MVSSGLLRRVALVRTQKTPFFIVTAVKTSNLTYCYVACIFSINLFLMTAFLSSNAAATTAIKQ